MMSDETRQFYTAQRQKCIKPTGTTIAMAILWLLPALVHLQPGFRLNVGLPRIRGGDEPHYFVMLNNLLRGRGFELSRTYEEGERGENTMGQVFAGTSLDHHSLFVRKTPPWEVLRWTEVFDPNTLARRPERVALDLHDYYEVAHHPWGLSLALTLLLFMLRATPFLESAAVLMALPMGALGVYLLWLLLQRYTNDIQVARLTLLTFAFGTPLWHYGVGLWTESYTWVLLLASLYLLIVRKQAAAAGICLGLAFGMRWQMALGAAVSAVWLLQQRRRRAVILFLAGFLPFVLLQLGYNGWVFGRPLFFSLPVGFVSHPLQVMENLLTDAFSPEHGVFTFAPVLLLALAGISLLRR